MTNITHIDPNQTPFDSIRQFDEHGQEFWLARDLMAVLGYKQWRRFNDVVKNAAENLETVVGDVQNHIASSGKLVERPQGGGNARLDYKLSRLAAYHVALCCDSRGRDEVKLAKHYFTVKTRERELQEQKEIQQQPSELDKKLQIAQEESRKAESEERKSENELQKTKLEIMPQLVQWKTQGFLDDYTTAQLVQQLTGSEVNLLPPPPPVNIVNGIPVDYMRKHWSIKAIAEYYQFRHPRSGRISTDIARQNLRFVGAGEDNDEFWEDVVNPYGDRLRAFKRSAQSELERLLKKLPKQKNIFEQMWDKNNGA